MALKEIYVVCLIASIGSGVVNILRYDARAEAIKAIEIYGGPMSFPKPGMSDRLKADLEREVNE